MYRNKLRPKLKKVNHNDSILSLEIGLNHSIEDSIQTGSDFSKETELTESRRNSAYFIPSEGSLTTASNSLNTG